MREYIKKQLEKCSYVNINNCQKIDNVYKINKYVAPHYEVNKGYIIKINEELVNAPQSLVATNWNHGASPKTAFQKAYITQAMQGMIFVNSLEMLSPNGPETGTMWCGWLPIRELTLIAEI